MSLAHSFSTAKSNDAARALDAGAAQERLEARIAAVVAVAAAHAEAVDRDARFPIEAFEEMRIQQLLGILLPPELGGEGASVSDGAQICYALGRVCSSTAMIYAMHLANVACVLRHANLNPRFAAYLRRIGEEQMLVASSTTEGQNGANVRSSASAIVSDGAHFSFSRNASVVSYGQAADAIVSTARRSPESLPTDQVLVLLFRDDYSLERTGKWDVLGMRGTCSEGFQLEARGEIEQVLSEPYESVHRRTMMPVTHLLWAACWAGVAAGAVERAQLFVRKAARGAKGALPPGAPLATEALQTLQALLGCVHSALADYECRAQRPEALEDTAFQTALNLLKVNASQLSIAAVTQALGACGIAGYRNDSPFSVARSLRDVFSTSVMINNHRILANVGPAALISGVPERLI